MKTYSAVKIEHLPRLAKAHRYILKARLSLAARKHALRKRGEAFELEWLLDSVTNLELELEQTLKRTYQAHRMYPYLKHIRGLGSELGAKLIGELDSVSQDGATGIACFDTLSKLWTFCGYGLPARKQSGKKLNYNPHLKSHLHKIAVSFGKSGNRYGNKFYEEVYLPTKEKETGKFDAVVKAKKGEVKTLPPTVTTELHIHRRAQRKMIKVFLGCLYYKWRELEGLPVRQTYAEEKLAHTTRYSLEDFIDT